MTTPGMQELDRDNIVNPDLYEMFDCSICKAFATFPLMCKFCEQLYCGPCVEDYSKTSLTNYCPFKCRGEEPLVCVPLYGTIKAIYDNIEKKCSIGCGLILKLKDASLHELECGKPKCDNHEKCREKVTGVINGFKVCSEKCAVYLTVLQQKSIGKEELSLLLTGLTMRLHFQSKKIHSLCYWDNAGQDPFIEISKNMKSVRNNSPTKGFKNVVSKVGFCSGVTVIELEVAVRQEKHIKVGVVKSLDFDREKAFSDSKEGYAYYTLGQLRHGDHAKGLLYGRKQLKEQIELVMIINSSKGTVSFIINGENKGVAFRGDELKDTVLYPAVALREGSKVTFVNNLEKLTL